MICHFLAINNGILQEILSQRVGCVGLLVVGCWVVEL